LSVAIVIDQAELAEIVHKEAHAGPGHADHFRERLLTESDWNDGRVTFLPIICEKQREPRKPPFARIERLINYVFLDPAVSGSISGR
jgi:hypothetical protein